MHQGFYEQNIGWYHPEDGRVKRRAALTRGGGHENEIMDTKPSAKQSNSLSIQNPHENDVLLGRGGNNNRHSGNEKLRTLARREAALYNISMKMQKSAISRQLVQEMRDLNPPARFLKQLKSGEWQDVGDLLAREKVSQVLRDAVQAMQEEQQDPVPITGVASLPVPVTSSSHRSRSDPEERGDFPNTTPVQSRKRRRLARSEDAPSGVDIVHRGLQWRSSPIQVPPQPEAIVLRDFSPPRAPVQQQPRLRRPLPVSRRQSSAASNTSLILRMGLTNDFDLFNGELLESDSEARNGPPSRSESPADDNTHL